MKNIENDKGPSFFPSFSLPSHRLHAVVRRICVNRIVRKLAGFDYSTKLSTLILVIMGKISGIRIVSARRGWWSLGMYPFSLGDIL